MQCMAPACQPSAGVVAHQMSSSQLHHTRGVVRSEVPLGSVRGPRTSSHACRCCAALRPDLGLPLIPRRRRMAISSGTCPCPCCASQWGWDTSSFSQCLQVLLDSHGPAQLPRPQAASRAASPAPVPAGTAAWQELPNLPPSWACASRSLKALGTLAHFVSVTVLASNPSVPAGAAGWQRPEGPAPILAAPADGPRLSRAHTVCHNHLPEHPVRQAQCFTC